MKPVTTWIVLANARHVRVVSHAGLGKGLHMLDDIGWEAKAVDLPRDKAGVGHSIAGPGISAVEKNDPQALADADFAKTVCEGLKKARADGAFDRLIIAAGPHMLGLMRNTLSGELKSVVTGEIAKDLTGRPMSQIETHVGEIMAI